MIDNLDRASDYAEFERELQIKNRASAEIEPGRPGECDECGMNSERLVKGLCVQCRNEAERKNRSFSPL
jgi:hypothetical protein